MRKSFGPKPWLYPQPVLILGTFDEDGTPDAMNAAWGGISDADEIFVSLSLDHKTVENIRKKGALTISVGTKDMVAECDYIGIVSGNKVKDKATAVKENIKDMPTQTAYAVHSAKEKAKSSVSDFKRGIVQGQETRQSQRADKREQHRQNIADKRMELQKTQEAKQAGRTTDGSATTGATRPHDRPVTASPASKTDTGKVQEIKRPVTSDRTSTDKIHTEPTKAQPVKERPLASKSAEPVLQKHGTRLNGVELNQQTTRKERNIKKATLNMTGKKGRKK